MAECVHKRFAQGHWRKQRCIRPLEQAWFDPAGDGEMPDQKLTRFFQQL
ncbi:MAG TPA: hypothetical protein VJQ82_22225 [Terriglobales bacterium]|nr:hypothetical protein [Terriglobales bacterium]